MGLYLGLISGTSMDAVDAALVDFERTPFGVIATGATALEPGLKRRIAALIDSPDRVSLDEIGQADVALGRAFARAALDLLHRAGVDPARVDAIGSPGQPLRHRPDLVPPFTWQIGDPNAIAESTGITVVADFRRRDVAAGGQGAPLVPLFNDQAFRSPHEDRVILNLGGIANITMLTAGTPVIGFDTGPANRLLDAWAAAHLGREFDADGAWAASGRCDPALLDRLLDDPYFALAAPKSTGRELFNLPWLAGRLAGERPRPQDVQATLLELTAASVADAVRRHAPQAAVYTCGGGSHNRALLAALARRLAPNPVSSTAALGLDPDFVEAIAFAWFARRTLAGVPMNTASVTGAAGARILGGIYRHG